MPSHPPRGLKLRGKVWWIRYCRNGTRYEESSHSTKQGDAITLLKLREGDGAKGIPVTPALSRYTFTEAAADIVNDYKINQRRSLKHLTRRLDKHLRPFFGSKRMAAITPTDARAYTAARLEEKAAPGSVNRELAVLKRMFTLAVQAGRLLFRPHVPLLREDNVRTGFFAESELDAVIAALPPDVAPVIHFYGVSGWRLQEALTLDWRNVDRAARIVRLDAAHSKNGQPRDFPYGQHPALVTLFEARWAEHQRLAAQGILSPVVFTRADGRPIRDFRDAWAQACEAAGCPGRLIHDLRRTAARNLIRRGVSEAVAMRLIGHKTPSIFRRYVITTTDDLAEAVGKLATPQPEPRKRATVRRLKPRG